VGHDGGDEDGNTVVGSGAAARTDAGRLGSIEPRAERCWG
jgi:hypothetical protein